MNPSVFLSPTVFHIHQLVCHFSLNFMEVISLLRAWIELQWTPCYFCTVCEKMMKGNELKVRGIFIGHYVLEKMYRLYYYRKQDPKQSHPGKRFFDYRNVIVPDKDAWCESVEKIVYVTLQSFRNDIKPSTKKECVKLYKETFNRIESEIPGAGILKVNHLIGAMAIIGVLPLWYIGLFHKVHQTKGIDHLVDVFKLKKGAGPTQTLMNALIQALSIQFGHTFTARECENILCKVMRKDISSDNKWCDVVYQNQGIFEPYDDHIIIHVVDHNNSQKNIEGKYLHGPLLKYWPFHNEWIDVSTYLKNLNIKEFEDYQKQVQWEINNGEYSHESWDLLC